MLNNEIRELAVLTEIYANARRFIDGDADNVQLGFDNAGMLLDSVRRSCDDDDTCDNCGDCRD